MPLPGFFPDPHLPSTFTVCSICSKLAAVLAEVTELHDVDEVGHREMWVPGNKSWLLKPWEEVTLLQVRED